MHPSNSYASERFTKGGKGTSKSKIRTKLQATEQDTRNFISKTFDYITPLCILITLFSLINYDARKIIALVDLLFLNNVSMGSLNN